MISSHHTSYLPHTPEVASSKYKECKTNFILRAFHHPTHKTTHSGSGYLNNMLSFEFLGWSVTLQFVVCFRQSNYR